MSEFVVVHEFKVGSKYSVRYSVPPGEFGEEVAAIVRWKPARPKSLTQGELRDMERGREEVVRLLNAQMIWGEVEIVAPGHLRSIH